MQPIDPVLPAAPPPVPGTQPIPVEAAPEKKARQPIYISVLITVIAVLTGLQLARAILPLVPEIPYMLGLKQDFVFYNWTSYSPTLFIQRKYEIFDMYQMKEFHLSSRDYVHEIPAALGHVPTLEQVYIDNNPIQSIPESLTQSPHLTSLYILNGKLTAIPKSISNLTNLNELTLVGNHITRVPDSIGDLPNLELLSLAYNDLESLPSSIANMNKLRILDLTGNRLREFPRLLPPNLELLFIGGNRIPVNILRTKTYPRLSDIIY